MRFYVYIAHMNIDRHLQVNADKCNIIARINIIAHIYIRVWSPHVSLSLPI
jgi:hypothetical protein